MWCNSECDLPLMLDRGPDCDGSNFGARSLSSMSSTLTMRQKYKTLRIRHKEFSNIRNSFSLVKHKLTKCKKRWRDVKNIQVAENWSRHPTSTVWESFHFIFIKKHLFSLSIMYTFSQITVQLHWSQPFHCNWLIWSNILLLKVSLILHQQLKINEKNNNYWWMIQLLQHVIKSWTFRISVALQSVSS